MATPNDWQLSLAVRALKHSGIIAYPTEAVWGLGCDPLDRDAVWRLLELKRRHVSKGLILIAASLVQLAPFLAPLNARTRTAVAATWPGPVTWLLPTAEHCPDWLTGGKSTLAVRVSAHPVCEALCLRWGGPLVSTSANTSGRPPTRRREQLRKQFATGIDYVVPGELGGRANPTEIRDAASGTIVRAG